MKLQLVLKEKWYDMIVSGEKAEEYREHTKYWHRRIWMIRKEISSIVFHRGYTDTKHERECISISSGIGRPEWGAPEGEVIIIQLGKQIQ